MHGRYLDFARKRKGDALLVVLPAVILLAQSEKSRLACPLLRGGPVAVLARRF